jgi:hypothetical protein
MTVMCQVSTAAASAGDGLIDIGIGAGGSEKIIIPDLSSSENGHEQLGYGTGMRVPHAVNLPAGTRIAAHSQNVVHNATGTCPAISVVCSD